MRFVSVGIPLIIIGLAACARADRAAEAPAAEAAPADPNGAESAGASRAAPAEWRSLAARVQGTGPVERFVSASSLFLGVPYLNGPLGEGEGGDVDPDPRVDFGHVDCVTYLEEALALALVDPAGPDDAYLAALDRIRYADGIVDYAHRNHYMVRDWIPANRWLLTDVSAQVAGDAAQTVTRTIDREKFLRDNGATPRPGEDDVREMKLTVVPGAAAHEVDARLKSGDLILWVGEVTGIFSLHTGLAVRGKDGNLLLRHGSSKAGEVLDESFADYAERRAKFVPYFVVLRLHEDATLPGGTPRG
jgi:hypothetical protein